MEFAGFAVPSSQPIAHPARFVDQSDPFPHPRKGYWRMSQNELVRIALNNRWLEEQGVPDMKDLWTTLYYGPKARV